MSEADKPKLIIDGDWKKRDDQPKAAPTPAAGPADAGANKIAVDSDWKSQAAAEKERLASQEQKGSAGAGGRGGAAAREIPPADFQGLMSTLVSQALVYMGAFPDPATGRAMISLEYAGFHIDLLEVLEQKTKGNLTQQESEDITQVLAELRSRYVELQGAVAQAVREGRLGRPGAGGLGGAGGGGGGLTGGAMGNMKITP
jgi:hypothetical protein